jgi:hypothetical protein
MCQAEIELNFEKSKEFDTALSNVAAAVFAAYADQSWDRVRYFAKFTPTADVWSGDYDLIAADGSVDESTLPETMAAYAIDKLALRHWQLTQDLGQPRWYKMIVTVERSGKFTVEFEYKDDYQEGDIMKRG